DDAVQREGIADLFEGNDVNTTCVASAEEALQCLAQKKFDCVVVDLGLPQMSGFELVRKIRDDSALMRLPIIVYTGRDLDRNDDAELRRLAETVIVKDVRSPERLLVETALFLHRV